MLRIQIIVFLASILVLFFVSEKVRRRHLAVEYSLIWIISGLVMMLLALWRNSLEYIASLMGIEYAPSAIFVIFGVFVLSLSIHFTLIISKLSHQNRVLVQKYALLEHEFTQLEERYLYTSACYATDKPDGSRARHSSGQNAGERS